MKFSVSPRNVVFDFVYGSYVVSIADYVSQIQNRTFCENRISIMVLKNDKSVSIETLDKIAEYIDSRISGSVSVSPQLIDVSLEDHDQIMQCLLRAIEILLPY